MPVFWGLAKETELPSVLPSHRGRGRGWAPVTLGERGWRNEPEDASGGVGRGLGVLGEQGAEAQAPLLPWLLPSGASPRLHPGTGLARPAGGPSWCQTPPVRQAASPISFYLPSSPGREDSIAISWMKEVRRRDLTFSRSQSQWLGEHIQTPPLLGARNPTIPRASLAPAGGI